MQKPPIPQNIALSHGLLNTSWAVWFERLHAKFNLNGTTAQRPTVGVEIGDQYFDTTLGFPIWAKSIDPIVWVSASGVIV